MENIHDIHVYAPDVTANIRQPFVAVAATHRLKNQRGFADTSLDVAYLGLPRWVEMELNRNSRDGLKFSEFYKLQNLQ